MTKKSSLNQYWYKRLQLVQILCSTSIMFLSGMAEQLLYSYWLLSTFSMIMAIATAVLSLNKYHDKWIEYRTTSETLKHEKYLYLANVDPYHQVDKFPLLVTRVEFIISSQNSNWTKVQHGTVKERSGENTS